MKAFYSDTFELPLPSKHRFPLAKYRLLRERIASESAFQNVELLIPDAPSQTQLRLVHHESYLTKLATGNLTALEQRRIGFPWSRQMVERSRRSTGATLAAARAALRENIAAHLAGGTHHAFPDHGQGFCVFNDVAVAIRALQAEEAIGRSVVIDCDVHQGNGTAAIFAQDESVFTFSMHGAKNYPFAKCNGDLDIACPDGTTDEPYLRELSHALRDSIPWDGVDCVFYLAGADPYHGDRYGRLSLTKEGLARRDALVISFCRERSLPVTVVMAGGYAANVMDIVDIHAQTVRCAAAHQ